MQRVQGLMNKSNSTRIDPISHRFLLHTDYPPTVENTKSSPKNHKKLPESSIVSNYWERKLHPLINYVRLNFEHYD